MMKYKCYNKSIKERFLNNIDIEKYPPGWWERVFDKSYVFEELYKRDLYDFSTSNLIDFLKYLDLANINNLIVYKLNLTKYAEWAVSENLVSDNQIHFNELTMELLNSCISKARISNAIISYKKLKSIPFVNKQDKFVFWSIFEGIKGKDYEEIINLKIEDIDQSTQTVTLCTGRTIKVSSEFINAAQGAWDEDEYVTLKDADIVLPLFGDYIFKEKRMSRGIDKPRSVYNTIVRNINYFPELSGDVTARSIRDSGLIHYLNDRADDCGVSVSELFYDLPNCKDIIDKYGFNILTRKKWLMMYEEYLH